MGEVYRATDSTLERTVAVKLLSPRYADQADARARFRREALAAARLSAAPNVVTIFDVAEHEGRPLIVMEYLEGGSVHDRVQKGRVSQEQALAWLEQAAQALDRAHRNGIVHRDVKPANLLLDREGNVHVADFGIASATGSDTLTLPGMVLGTAGYLSPEQARGEPATAASDRYALGVVAFELLTGRRPFAGDTPTTEAFAHLNADIPSATALDPMLPERVDAVFEDALAKDPAVRPATASELVDRLRAALASGDEEGLTTIASAPATRVYPPASPGRPVYRTRRRPRLGVVALLATALLAGGFVVTALLGAKGDSGAAGKRRAASQLTTSAATTAPESSKPAVDGAALADQGYALMQQGDFASAAPILRNAVVSLNGDGTLTEAYADYNLAYTRFQLGRCDGVTALLDRSERIQGRRDQIDELRAQWEERCGTGTKGPAGKGHGKAKGREGDEG